MLCCKFGLDWLRGSREKMLYVVKVFWVLFPFGKDRRGPYFNELECPSPNDVLC